ncbi:MAG: hypothetical protein HY099_04495 [Nitrospirae bacterium]|nr:hypothetical protein [Nitrospirota bacterium]
MKKLYKGIHKFQESYFKKEEEFFKRLSRKQEPDVLFVACADSRVGHSNCGAMQALYRDEKELEGMPHLRDWLKLALPVKEAVNAFYSDYSSDSIQRIMEKENILAQLRNIQTYPFVAKALEEGLLYLHGWYYEIHMGKVYAYNPNTDTFEDIIFI